MGRRDFILRSFWAAAFLLWATLIFSAFYITQHPLALQVAAAAATTLGSLALWGIMLVDACVLGYWILEGVQKDTEPDERLLLGTGLGLGALGFLGYALGAAGLATRPILALFLLTPPILAFRGRTFGRIRGDLGSLRAAWQESHGAVPAWAVWAVLLTLGISFLFTLLPPADGFDGLLYHLALPEQLLKDEGIVPHDVVQFWFPSLTEGDYLWAVGLGSERTAQMIHWSFMILTLGVVWNWSRKVFGARPAGWALVVLVSMPSLPWLAAWAYSDMALAFTVAACLYCLWRWPPGAAGRWLILSGLFAGMAMGIKYTSFILPLTCAGFILAWGGRRRIASLLQFSLPALLTAIPWYLRNWLLMGNPVYPFMFGGLYWDAFRAAGYSASGTGIGWNLRELVLLPLTIMTGHRDQNFYDGRVGPLILLLLPLAIWVVWAGRRRPEDQRRTLAILATFSFLAYALWTLGVVQTAHLWQSRLLWPGLFALAIPMGLGVLELQQLNIPRLRMDFIVTTLMALVIAITLLDNTLSLIYREPLAASLGMESRASYFERIQPRYAQALNLVGATPANAYVYFLFEPRSYGMPRRVQPDAINDNLMHDFHVSGTAEAVASRWRSEGYTHLLLCISCLEANSEVRFQELLPYLRLENETSEYRLYALQGRAKAP